MQWWCAAQGVAWSWSWQAYPGVWAFVGLCVAGYATLVRREPNHPRAATATFLLGVLVLWAALDWPLGALGAGYLASVHMVQFLMIALIAPPLLLLGLPQVAYERIAPRVAGPVGRAATHPLFALGFFTVALSATHWPPVVDGFMPTQLGNFALDMIWLVAGVVFWWPVVAPVPPRPGFGYPAKMGYLILATILNTGTFAYLTFTDLPLYAVYELAPPFPGLTARDDQTIAGLLMKMGGAAVLWTAITVLFARWWIASGREGT